MVRAPNHPTNSGPKGAPLGGPVALPGCNVQKKVLENRKVKMGDGMVEGNRKDQGGKIKRSTEEAI